MTAPAPSDTSSGQADDVAILRRLPTLLLREGYIDAYTVFGTLHLDFQRVRDQLDLLPPATRLLMRLFFLGEALPPSEVASVLSPDEVGALRRLGILLESDGAVHSGGLIALPVSGMLMLVPMPHVNQAVYFGDDSAALAARLSPARGARCLDLCAGPGIQTLRAATAGGTVVAVEINPVAAACAELNVVLNGLEDRVEIRRGDLYNALRPDERFDFVSANPPLLPFVPDLPYPFVGHGGADGLAVTRRILQRLPEVLRPGGVAQIIGTCLGDSEGPAARAELARYAEERAMQVVMTVPARLPLRRGDPMFDGLSWTCAAAAGLDLEVVKERFAAHLERLGADSLYTFYLTISQGAPRPGFSLTEHYRRPGGFWFR